MSGDYPGRVEYRTKDGIVRAVVTPDPDTAEHDLLAIIADVERVAIDELPAFYTQAGHFVEELFQTPPSEEAQMEISFSYAGYRVTLNRSGDLKLVDVKESMNEF